MKLCVKCTNSFTPKKGLINYCSLQCRNSRTWTMEDIKKKSIAAKSSMKVQQANRDPAKLEKVVTSRIKNGNGAKKKKMIECTNCKKIVEVERNESGNFRTWCTSECYAAIKRRNYRGKNFNYKGISLDSSWELELAIWLDSQSIEWERPKYLVWVDIAGKSRKYFPDFYLPRYNLYVDPKNELLVESQKEKLEKVSEEVKLIYGRVDYLKEYIGALV